MKLLIFRALLALVLATLHSAPLAAAEAANILAKESLGPIKVGQTAAALEKALGATDKKGKEVEQGATGEWVQEWAYPAQGVKIVMTSTKKGGAKTVSAITAVQGCKLATARGIRIGSPIDEVRKVYGKVEASEEGEKGRTFVAGSIYGGVIFTLQSGKVTGIFLGAAAE